MTEPAFDPCPDCGTAHPDWIRCPAEPPENHVAFVMLTKRSSEAGQMIAIRADAVLAVVDGSHHGAAIYIRDHEHAQPLGVEEDARTVVARITEALAATRRAWRTWSTTVA